MALYFSRAVKLRIHQKLLSVKENLGNNFDQNSAKRLPIFDTLKQNFQAVLKQNFVAMFAVANKLLLICIFYPGLSFPCLVILLMCTAPSTAVSKIKVPLIDIERRQIIPFAREEIIKGESIEIL